jgi:DNA repair protein RAD50
MKNKLIEHRTTLMANNDLDAYYKALDKALMHFHAIKMKSINETLKEYWRATYRGKGVCACARVRVCASVCPDCGAVVLDIDEISIHSDVDTTSAKGRRQYNYRVLMKQGDTGKTALPGVNANGD